jgi:hypothetical protein
MCRGFAAASAGIEAVVTWALLAQRAGRSKGRHDLDLAG